MKTEKVLIRELASIDKKIRQLINRKIEIEEKLGTPLRNDLTGIELRLFYKIYCENKRPTQAVKEVADENFNDNITPCSISRIWYYYKKLKNL